MIDPKRRQVETTIQTESSGHDNIQCTEPKNTTGPKNLDMAGFGL